MVLNQKGKMEVGKIPQHVQKNPTMVKEDMDPSCVFYINVNEPHILCASFQWWRFTTLEKGHGFWI